MKGTCPVCDASINLDKNVEESEILTCSECHTRVVVEKVEKDTVKLNEAPAVEEDWGE